MTDIDRHREQLSAYYDLEAGGYDTLALAVARYRPTVEEFFARVLRRLSGVANVIVTPDLFERSRFELLGSHFLLIDGALQNMDHSVSVKAARVEALSARVAADLSHDFH